MQSNFLIQKNLNIDNIFEPKLSFLFLANSKNISFIFHAKQDNKNILN